MIDLQQKEFVVQLILAVPNFFGGLGGDDMVGLQGSLKHERWSD